MRDLASRLRAIVRQDNHVGCDFRAAEITPDVIVSGGRIIGDACIEIDRVFDATRSHGRWRVEQYAPEAAMPLALLDPRCAGVSDWASRPVFFDIETTGLSGGAGTIAFLVGCGWFEDAGFRVRQFLLTGLAGEPALLAGLGALLAQASLIVTFNGRTFDLPFMDMRWAFHRTENPIAGVPHFDMLPPARRLWGSSSVRDAAAESGVSCSLTALERNVLGFHRLDDVPGMEIPVRYFQFLRTGEAALIEGILEHNRHDLMSLAAIASHALRLVGEGPELCRDGHEQCAIGRVYERAGLIERAREAYGRAAHSMEDDARAHASARLAVLLRREGKFGEAADAWQRVLDERATRRSPPAMTPLQRAAAEALAIHHEHRAKDPVQARRYADLLRQTAAAPARVAHRLNRLDRKITSAENATGGQKAARLLPD